MSNQLNYSHSVKCRGCGRVLRGDTANELARRLAAHLLHNTFCTNVWCEDLDALLVFHPGRRLALLPTLHRDYHEKKPTVFGVSPNGELTIFRRVRSNEAAEAFIAGCHETAETERRERVAMARAS